MWEIRPDEYMVVANSNKNIFKDRCKTEGVYNNNYVIDATVGKGKPRLREAHFLLDVEFEEVMSNNRVTTCFGLGSLSVFYTY